jgi:hypothetical protein
MLCIACNEFNADQNGLCVGCNDDLFSGSDDATNVAKKLLKRINAMSGELSNYEQIATMYSATLAVQHETIERLQTQLTAALRTVEVAIERAGGKEYAEGCAP